uniref:UBA domain-containing protein n=2 Tax=Auxenochlorella protothecoides TaxID=3075 RepID=A0A1D2A6T0_AUXPR
MSTEMEMAKARAVEAGEGTDKKDVELVEPEVDGQALAELEAMGFARNRGVRALHGSGNTGVESAVAWLADHEDDADLDSPLLLPKETPKPSLTPEEAKALAAELLAKARRKRELEEKELQRLREQERIRSGKELAAAARLEAELKLKRSMEARRLEKEEERKARERVREMLEEDKRARRVRLGLPPEPTPEELEAERAKAAEKAAQEAAKRLPPPPVIPDADRLRDLLVGMKRGTSDAAAVTLCFQTLLRLCGNAANDPGNAKYRRLNLGNPALAARLLPDARAFLEAAGWAAAEGEGEGVLVLPGAGSPAEVVRLTAAGVQLHSALNNPFFGAL